MNSEGAVTYGLSAGGLRQSDISFSSMKNRGHMPLSTGNTFGEKVPVITTLNKVGASLATL